MVRQISASSLTLDIHACHPTNPKNVHRWFLMYTVDFNKNCILQVSGIICRKKKTHLCWKRLVKEDVCLSFWNGPFFRWHVPSTPPQGYNPLQKFQLLAECSNADGWLLPRGRPGVVKVEIQGCQKPNPMKHMTLSWSSNSTYQDWFSKEIPTQWWINQNGMLFEKNVSFSWGLKKSKGRKLHLR